MATSYNSSKATSKQVNIYTRRHPFVLSSTESFTTSQRRAFLRDVYDYSRSLGLSKKDAKQQTIRAREMCGEDEYNSDETSLENEIDDSQIILRHLQDPPKVTTKDLGSSLPVTTTAPSTKNGNSVKPVFPDRALLNLQKRKRRASDVELDSRTAQMLNGSNLETSARPPGDQRVKRGRPKQTNSGEERIIARKDKSSSQELQNSQSSDRSISKPINRPARSIQNNAFQHEMQTSQGSKMLAEIDSKPVTSHQGSPVTTGVPSSKTPATNATNKKSTKNSVPFEPPEVVAFSDDDEESLPVGRKSSSTALDPKIKPA